MLIKNITDLKKFITVDGSTNIESLQPFLIQSETRYIQKVLGKTLYNTLDNAYNTGGGAFTAELEALWKQVNISNVNLAWYLYLPFANIRMSEKGLVTASTGETQQITKWMYDTANIRLKETGYNGLDSLYKFLAENNTASWYATWQADSGYLEYSSLLVNSSDICSRLTPVNYSRWIYNNLLPHLKSVEKRIIGNSIGADFFADLQTKYHAGTAGTEEQYVISTLQDIISLMAYAAAIRDPNIRQEITVMQGSQMDGISATGSNRADVSNPMSFSFISTQYTNDANSMMSQLIDYLNANASSVLFPIYFTSDKYKDPTVVTPVSNYNNNTSKIFAIL